VTPSVRSATPADAQAIATTEAVAAHGPWSERAVQSHFQTPGRLSHVAPAEGPVLGHLLSATVVDEAELLTLAVRPTARRRGLARALLRHAHAAWAAAGVRRAFLEVRDDNAPARGLYEAEGWVPVGRRKGYYRDGCDAVLYRWEAT